MPATEFRILTKIIEAGTLDEARRLGLKSEHFTGTEAKAMWDYLNKFWNTPETEHTLPTFAKVRKRYPGFLPTSDTGDEVQTLARLITDLKDSKFQNDVLGVADHFSELARHDPMKAIQVAKEEMRSIEIVRGSETIFTTLGNIESIAKERYYGAQSGAVFGIPWPWKCLTEDTLGKQPGELYIFYGRMKSMKTWILLYNAVYDFLENHCRVLIWSREMDEVRLSMRVASLLGKVDYQMFKAGMLPPKLEKKVFDIIHKLVTRDIYTEDLQRSANSGSADLMLLSGHNAPRTLAELNECVQKFQPHVLYLDSYYHMESERSSDMNERNKKLAAFSEDLKAYAMDHEIPIVAVHQANRSGEKTYGNTMVDLADTDVLAREADLICRCLMRPDGNTRLWEDDYEVEFKKIMDDAAAAKLTQSPRMVQRIGRPIFGPLAISQPDEKKTLAERLADRANQERKSAQIGLVMGGNREGVLKGFIIRAIPGYNFEMLNDQLSMADIKAWVQAEEKADEDVGKGTNGGTPGRGQSNFQEALRRAAEKRGN
jgi:hypothetical protein